MEHADLGPNDGSWPSYYLDNIAALVEALEILGDAPNTGDWWGELQDYLKRVGADGKRANVKPSQMALDILQRANEVNVLELMALIETDLK
jgi:hypothetical protein